MKTIFYNSRIAEFFTYRRGFKTIMLFGFIFTEKKELSNVAIYHESIHQRQYVGMLVVGLLLAALASLVFGLSWIWFALGILLYYIIYVAEWLVRLIQYDYPDDAYYNISFERQAYALQGDYRMPKSSRRRRTFFGWIKFLNSGEIIL